MFDPSSEEERLAARKNSVLISRGATAPPATAAAANATAVGERTLEDVHEGMEVWCELCSKVGQSALRAKDFKKAQVCGFMCASSVPEEGRERDQLPINVWRWHALAECVWGQSIFMLIDPTKQERALQDDLRDTRSVVFLYFDVVVDGATDSILMIKKLTLKFIFQLFFFFLF